MQALPLPLLVQLPSFFAAMADEETNADWRIQRIGYHSWNKRLRPEERIGEVMKKPAHQLDPGRNLICPLAGRHISGMLERIGLASAEIKAAAHRHAPEVKRLRHISNI